jgi:very-short-patch-repair endonuclease
MSPTSIERALSAEFEKRNLSPVVQFAILNYVVDFAFPERSLAIEADGTYWHGLALMIAKDARKDADLSAAGWTVLHFTETEINASAHDCVDRILPYLI